MKSWEYEAVGYEGEIYCVKCLPNGIDMQSGDASPIFACTEWDAYPVCCVCGHEHNYVDLIQ